MMGSTEEISLLDNIEEVFFKNILLFNFIKNLKFKSVDGVFQGKKKEKITYEKLGFFIDALLEIIQKQE